MTVRLRAAFCGICIVLLGAWIPASAKRTSAVLSAYRRYVWGARDAYDAGRFTKAHALLAGYREAGSPGDPILEQAGCDLKAEVEELRTAVKSALQCQTETPPKFWPESERAKVEILLALREGKASELVPYVDCGPQDVTPQPTVCGTRRYPIAADWARLADYLRAKTEILAQPNWRQFPPATPKSSYIRWILYTYSLDWMPCGMSGAPILSLRQDNKGRLRIAGYSAGCLDSRP
ncbi:MAG TPA: hypothetical protein VMU17_03415 [Elusimicrobiota bacterium]|nr:hypothetical protein [Elusimicrobiota bacterium]